MIPIHPQVCPGAPQELRWFTPPGVLTLTGRVAAAPGPLGALLDDGTLAEVRAEVGAVVTRLGEGRSWSGEGARVRSALHAALDEPAGWQPAPTAGGGSTGDLPAAGPAGSDDALLRAAAQDLLDGSVGQFARSHGGIIELIDVHDGIVEVRLGGACHGCPAARVTMHMRLERHLRQRCPGLREVRDVGASSVPTGLFRFLPGRGELSRAETGGS